MKCRGSWKKELLKHRGWGYKTTRVKITYRKKHGVHGRYAHHGAHRIDEKKIFDDDKDLDILNILSARKQIKSIASYVTIFYTSRNYSDCDKLDYLKIKDPPDPLEVHYFNGKPYIQMGHDTVIVAFKVKNLRYNQKTNKLEFEKY